MADAAFGKNPIGIIQGRLTASGGRLQAFPIGRWKEEFSVARDVGFDRIELIVERPLDAPNPIWTPEGVREIAEAAEASGVQAKSLCDDQIMDGSLLKGDGPEAIEAVKNLARLIRQSALAGVETLVIPFLEQASLKDDRDAFLSAKRHLEQVLPVAEACGVALVLENDLPTALLKEFVSGTDGKVGVCYDSGNRAYFGYDPAEILELGDLIRHVHIKDKLSDGKNVMLGTGKVDFKAVTANLRSIGYAGPLILETSRGDEDVQAGRDNLAFVKALLR